MSTFLKDLALEHQRHEGWFPGSLSQRNNNPGNLRAKAGHFVRYPTYAIGFAALMGDVSMKIENRSPSMQRYYDRHKITYELATFLDYINVYAPTADRNNPSAYTLALCQNLKKYNLNPSTKLSVMAQLVRGEIERVPDLQPPIISPEARVRGLERRLKHETNPTTREIIARKLQRLLARVNREP